MRGEEDGKDRDDNNSRNDGSSAGNPRQDDGKAIQRTESRVRSAARSGRQKQKNKEPTASGRLFGSVLNLNALDFFVADATVGFVVRDCREGDACRK